MTSTSAQGAGRTAGELAFRILISIAALRLGQWLF